MATNGTGSWSVERGEIFQPHWCPFQMRGAVRNLQHLQCEFRFRCARLPDLRGALCKPNVLYVLFTCEVTYKLSRIVILEACSSTKLKMAFAATDPPMSSAAMKLLLMRPKVPAPLDPNFAPLVLGVRNYLSVAADCQLKIEWALPRADGCGRGSLPVFGDDDERFDASVFLAGVLIQEMFWERSASELLLSGPTRVCEAVKAAFSVGGKYEFEVLTMPNMCGTPSQPFEVKIVSSPDWNFSCVPRTAWCHSFGCQGWCRRTGRISTRSPQHELHEA